MDLPAGIRDSIEPDPVRETSRKRRKLPGASFTTPGHIS
jgi:hypothetical protein